MILSRCLIPRFLICGLLFLAVGVGRAAEPIFETDIRPILVSKCGQCHSDKVRKGGLNLSTMTGLRQGGESGEAAVAEALDESLLWVMISSGSMPPEDQPQLAAAESELIRQWIESGSPAETPHQVPEKRLTQHDVLPILLLRCTACHGATLKQSGVDLRTVAGIMQGGKRGPIFKPGNPDDSLLIQRIESEACPPQNQLLKFFVRRPPTSEVQTLREWIAAGASIADATPDVATTDPDPLVAPEDRRHWAFQSPQAVPGDASLDDFIQEKLLAAGLEFSPEADRDTLIRRCYLDLIGMPPDLEAWQKWRGAQSAEWYAEMIDHLLESSHYGERWGRYWLDLAGYADSEGGVSSDPVREVAWKYRDYVINAFNTDKPYDRFLLEQIAGDELLDAEKADVVTAEMVENLTATGFLRMGIDQTGSRTMNFVPERLGVINDAITIVGSGLMGLTLECARCHTHKYDPVPHRDYYRFKAIFQGAFDEYDWLSFRNRELKIATPEHRRRVAEINPPLIAEVKKLTSELKSAVTAHQLQLLQTHYPEQSDADRQETLRALRIADNSRTLTQRILVEKLQTAQALPDHQQTQAVLTAAQQVADLEEQIERVQQQMEPSENIRAVWDRGRPSYTYVLRRGDHDKPGQLVGPGVPSVLTDGRTPFTPKPPFPDGTAKTGRRLAFARWLTQPRHPTTARVMVNRIWYHHFGTGLVKSLENFGVKGDRPSHPELLDWLAVTFEDSGWSVKHMHRIIMNSRTYRQSSRVTEEVYQADPQNRLLSRMLLQRMDAEALRDSLLSVSGMLESTPGGRPDSVTVDRDGLVSVRPTTSGKWRRSVYLQYRRTEIPSLMDTFDYPEMGPNCQTRSVSTVSPQSLMLMNNAHVHQLAGDFADRVVTLAPEAVLNDPAEIVTLVSQLALSRSPSVAELQSGVEMFEQLVQHWNGDDQAAVHSYCHVILNSAAFVYVD